MRKIFLFAFVFLLLGCSSYKSQSNKIPLEKIDEMFSNLKAKGVNTDTKMLWGYFFNSATKDKLALVSNELKTDGFEFVKIFQA